MWCPRDLLRIEAPDIALDLAQPLVRPGRLQQTGEARLRPSPGLRATTLCPSSLGQFGWYGAATTYCQIDPKEKIVAVAFVQHFPFNEHNFFARFATGYYQALR